MGKTFRREVPERGGNAYVKTEANLKTRQLFENRREQRFGGIRADKNSRFIMRDYECEAE